MCWHRSDPLRELSALLVADGDTSGGSEHPQSGTADVGERHIDLCQREGLGVGDQPSEPQPHRSRIIEDPVKGGADRVQVEQRLVDIENDDRSMNHRTLLSWVKTTMGGIGQMTGVTTMPPRERLAPPAG